MGHQHPPVLPVLPVGVELDLLDDRPFDPEQSPP